MSINGLAGIGLATETEFPFDGELRLDANPMPGFKRVPSMDIAANGAIVLEMANFGFKGTLESICC